MVPVGNLEQLLIGFAAVPLTLRKASGFPLASLNSRGSASEAARYENPATFKCVAKKAERASSAVAWLTQVASALHKRLR